MSEDKDLLWWKGKPFKIVTIVVSTLICINVIYTFMLMVNSVRAVQQIYTYVSVVELQSNNDKLLRRVHKDIKHLLDVDNYMVLLHRYTDLKGQPSKFTQYKIMYTKPYQFWITGTLSNSNIQDTKLLIRIKWKWFKITEYEDWVLDGVVRERDLWDRTYD